MSNSKRRNKLSKQEEASPSKLKELEQENADLKLLVAYYQELISYSEQTYNISIEKKSDTK